MCCPLIGMPLLKCEVWDVLTDQIWICTAVLAVVEEGFLLGGGCGVVGITATLAVPRQSTHQEFKCSCCN